jgi:regulator of sigma E protease
MNFAWYALWFIVAVGLLVTIHEFGHYWVARRLGFKVLRFSVGFGRPLWKRIGAAPDHVEYVIAAIPLGGYVKMLDEREGPVEPAEAHRSFTRKAPWQRIVVLLAGPAFNILFAILVLWAMLAYSGVTEVRPFIGEVRPDSIAALAGLHSGDEITAINGKPVAGESDVVFGLIDAMSGDGSAQLTLLRPAATADGQTPATATSTTSTPATATSATATPATSATANLVVSSADERRRLTEPTHLWDGLGFRFWEPPRPAILGHVDSGGAAGHAGLRTGDEILAIDGEPIHDFRDIPGHIAGHPGASAAITYRRNGVEKALRLTIDSVSEGGQRIGRIGVTEAPSVVHLPPSMLRHTDLSLGGAFTAAVDKAWDMTELQGRLFARMLTGQVSLKNLSGPLSIAQFAGESAEAGVASFFSFLVLISLSLGFLNLLPIPILDGGQILFQAIEWLKGSPLSDRAQAFGQQVGIALLLLLMGVALFNDLARQFG